jgi:hypothetical protein
MRWKFGVWIGPPNVLLPPKPTSSVRANKILGGNTPGVSAAEERGNTAVATAEATRMGVEPSRPQRLIPNFLLRDADFRLLI